MTKASDSLVQELLKRRTIACLATHNDDGSIHLTAVWFVFEDGHFYVGTQSNTRKARNLRAHPSASLMIDVREPTAERGVAAICKATLLTGSHAQEIIARVHQKYVSPAALADPRVGPVFAKMDDIAIELVPQKWTSWDMRVLGKMLFGDALKPGYFLPLE
ncbi:MAG: pyridoxamine 5'-phosphate oxidase family protein [Acidobacteriales bacterium]|nr:pyridoxamine 5'-phosphate oxidase family protein [Terriglobales bacterium]